MKQERRNNASGLRWLLICLLCFCSLADAQHGIEHSEQGPIIELSDETRNAIDSGISLTFVGEYAIRDQYLFIHWSTVKRRHTFRISRHALSDRYLVHIDDELKPTIFRSSLQGMIYIRKTIQRQFRRYASEEPELQLRLSLNKVELPAPMRLTAFLSNKWDLDSGWSRWQFTK